jgi:hypothetical protein
MRRRAFKRTNKNRELQGFKKILNLGLSQIKAIFYLIWKLCKYAIGYVLLTEIPMYILILGFAYLLVSWGMANNIALEVAYYLFCAFLALWALYCIFCFFNKSAKSGQKFLSKEVRLARWITQTFFPKQSTEWAEYQDWLHDILLARCQLLDAKSPRWQVTLLTYWRLSLLCLIVCLIKIRRATASLMKLR